MYQQRENRILEQRLHQQREYNRDMRERIERQREHNLRQYLQRRDDIRQHLQQQRDDRSDLSRHLQNRQGQNIRSGRDWRGHDNGSWRSRQVRDTNGRSWGSRWHQR